MKTRRVTSACALVGLREARRAVRAINCQNLGRGVAAVALGCGLYGASRIGRREIHRAQSPRLGWWPIGEPLRVSPIAEASTDQSACAGGRQGGRTAQESTGMESMLPQQDAADTRPKVRRPADGERVDVEWCLLEPSRVVADESERTETDLAALDQSSTGNHDEGDRTNCNSSNKTLKHLPKVGANCRGSKSDSRMGGRYGEARSLLWSSCTNKGFTSSGPSRRK